MTAANGALTEGFWSKENNIFLFRKYDAILYAIIYIIIPITITYFMLKYANDSYSTFILCYVSILINTVGCAYDCVGRWSSQQSYKNTKIICMAIPLIIVSSYCFSQIIGTLIAKAIIFREDWICLFYLLTCCIAVLDMPCCFLHDIILIKKSRKSLN